MTGNKNITVGDEDEPKEEDLGRQEHADKPATSPKRFREEESNVDDRESKKRHVQDIGTSSDAGDQTVTIDRPGDEVPAEYPNPFLGYKASAPKVKGFIITGHPGIGKTISLYYVFLLRLQASQPTILITHPDKVTIFLQQGIFSISMVDFEEVVNLIPISTWCLVDCNESLERVPEAIVKTPFFILQTASPSKHLQLQNKALGILQYVMKPFSLSELIIGRNRSLDVSETPSEESLREYYRQYTPSARFAYQYAGNIDKYRTFVQSLVSHWTIDHLKTLVGAFPTNVDFVSEQTLYHILTVTVEAGGQRSIPQVDIASCYISQLITEQLQPSPTVGATALGCCLFGVKLHELLAMAGQ
ncbi:uncharacterized protein EV420DRAFT_1497686 [Desarmillaria tabescens]|uniref:Uncharacterized protein n=1 Tax=Armillaria tabescens TaxID=1929756 RepID=A0AA39NQF4_ARMTA|nr:uncharacterized protein EV420DRAFT_1497686 [Desarmillaria tabescens]KAK0469959.1 hypothetical protein EV420DRAFT_1497686 [Desarmillaria tabescens]